MSQDTTLPIDKLLPRLTKVKVKKSTKDNLNHWQALCPAHSDKSPSLAITQCTDGTVLLKCWSGCNTKEIVESIDLTLKDLFITKNSLATKRQLNQPSKKAIEHEKLIILLGNAQTAKGNLLTPHDLKRYQLAVKRIRELYQ